MCGGVLEDQTIFRGKGGGISCRRQSLKGGNYRNLLSILKLPMSGDRKNIAEP